MNIILLCIILINIILLNITCCTFYYCKKYDYKFIIFLLLKEITLNILTLHEIMIKVSQNYKIFSVCGRKYLKSVDRTKMLIEDITKLSMLNKIVINLVTIERSCMQRSFGAQSLMILLETIHDLSNKNLPHTLEELEAMKKILIVGQIFVRNMDVEKYL